MCCNRVKKEIVGNTIVIHILLVSWCDISLVVVGYMFEITTEPKSILCSNRSMMVFLFGRKDIPTVYTNLDEILIIVYCYPYLNKRKIKLIQSIDQLTQRRDKLTIKHKHIFDIYCYKLITIGRGSVFFLLCKSNIKKKEHTHKSIFDDTYKMHNNYIIKMCESVLRAHQMQKITNKSIL